MRLHQVHLRNVRQIKELTLELTAPLTILGGANETGKSTFQQAILAAMFRCDKKTRDSLVSRFDPHTPPLATLHFRTGPSGTAAVLERRLTDDAGSWQKGDTIIKQKGKALEEVQKQLPICADAANLLLWGVQEDLARVIDGFPSDGHSLLTGAAIRGLGPDPKAIIEELDKEYQKAKSKAAKDPGSLARTEADVSRLEKEWQEAQQAEQRLQTLEQDYQQAKARQAQVQLQYETVKKEAAKLAELEKLLKPALKALAKVVELEKKQADWAGLEEELAKAARDRQNLQEERALLAVQLRVVRDAELADRIEKLQQQIERVEAAAQIRANLDNKVAARERPAKADVQKHQQLRARLKEARDKMAASGLRYTLAASTPGISIQLREDDDPPQQVMLQAGQPRHGVVGRLEIVRGGLEFTAAGKEDISSLKRTIDQAGDDLKALLARFHVGTDEEFSQLIGETTQLLEELTKATQARDKELQGSTLVQLKNTLAAAHKERNEIGVTEEDKRNCQDRHLGSVKVISDKHARVDGRVEEADKACKKIEGRRPSSAEEAKLKDDLKKARQEAESAVDKFTLALDSPRSLTQELLEEIEEALRSKQQELDKLQRAANDTAIKVASLASDLRNAAPKRNLASLEADLQEARAHLQREQNFQAGRELLRNRIQEKIEELAQGVPRELAAKIGDYFAQLTRGSYGGVFLNDDLTLAGVHQSRAAAEPWQPGQLSCGTRYQAALALKVAVARALAESAGPVFIILDDYLVHFDPDRRAATEKLLLDLVADGQLQVILLTCHTDWAADWSQRQPDLVAYCDFASRAVYYQEQSRLQIAD